MMRSKIFALAAAAALAAPLTAGAWPNKGSGCDSGGGGLFGWCKGKGGLFGAGGKLANAPPPASGKMGKGFFQPPFQAAPWYLYWPYDAHFQLPAPINAPFVPPPAAAAGWNPYFAQPHPALGLAGGPPPHPGVVPQFGPVPVEAPRP